MAAPGGGAQPASGLTANFGPGSLLTLARDNEVADIKLLVEAGYPVNLGNMLGQNALHIASIHGQLEAIQMLLQCGADVNQPNRRGTTALHFAARARKNSRACVEALVAAGARVQAVDASGLRPFEIAQDDDVRELLGGASRKMLDAAASGDAVTLRAEVTAGKPVNGCNQEGRSALALAAMGGRAECVVALIELGADVDQEDHEGFTPLHHAVSAGDLVMVQALLAAGADLSVPSRSMSEYASGQWSILKKDGGNGLDDPDVDPDEFTIGEDDKFPLHTAVEASDMPVVEVLLHASADVNVTDFDGRTPLHCALESGDLEMAERLLQAGAHADASNKDMAGTLLHAAARRGQMKVATMLLKYRADPSRADSNGWTPLHLAAQRGKEELLKLLADSGADLTAVVEATGNTALHLAALNSREAAAKFLAERCPMLKDQIVNADGKLPREVAKGDACVAACS